MATRNLTFLPPFLFLVFPKQKLIVKMLNMDDVIIHNLVEMLTYGGLLDVWLVLRLKTNSTWGHSIINCLYHSLMSLTENLVLVTRNSTSSSVRATLCCRLLRREAFQRNLDFMHDSIVEKPEENRNFLSVVALLLG